MTKGELLAHVYAGLFKFPLTTKEARLWRIKLQRRAESKLKIAEAVSRELAKIPFIEGVFLTGSVAAGGALKNADIDLMIITYPNTLWLTRFLATLFLKRKKLYKKIICPNIYLDANHLRVERQDLYTAHEVLQAKCLFDRSGIEYRWIFQNNWAKEYLPEAYRLRIKNLKPINKDKFEIKKYLLVLPEAIAFFGQYLYMKSKISRERVGWGYAFFHPRNLSAKVLPRFNRALRKLGIMEP